MQPWHTDQNIYIPARRAGQVFHSTVILTFTLISAACLWQAAHTNVIISFILYLLPAIASVGVVIWLSYRFYCLQNSYYGLSRDGIRIRWGLRYEEIPIDEIKWVNQETELSEPLPLPAIRWPGSICGQQSLSDGARIEFMASTKRELIVIAASDRYFAISPRNPDTFLLDFQRCIEMGSLTLFKARSVYPKFLFGRVWSTPVARYLFILSTSLSLILFILVGMVIPSRSQIRLGYLPNISPGSAVPAVRLMLLPIINAFFFVTNMLLGLLFFRREETQPLSYLLWGSGILTPLLFFVAVLFTLISG